MSVNLVYYTLYIVRFVINIGDRRCRHFGKNKCLHHDLARSRCGAGTLSTPLSRSHARSLPSLNQCNDNTVSDTTHLPRKTWQRWEKLSELVTTYQPVASSHQPSARDRRWTNIVPVRFFFIVSSSPSPEDHPLFISLFCLAIKFWPPYFVLVSWFFFFIYTPPLNRERPPHRGKKIHIDLRPCQTLD
jgi:hypothetical protein